MSVSGTSSGSGARAAGMIIFAIGIALMLLVFVLAAMTFSQLPQLIGGGTAAPQGIVSVLTVAAVRGGLLLVMAYVSSLLASKGLELYAVSKGGK